MDAHSTTVSLKQLRSPKTVVRRFVAKRALRSSLLWGVIFAIYMISKATSFIQTYTTLASREKLASTLGSNVGIEALLGVAHHLETISGYAVWNFLCLITAAGSIWAILLATKTFRGEEESGRWELFLAGQTTSRRAAANALAGLMSGLAVLYVFFAATLLFISRFHGTNFTIRASLFFALVLVAGAAEFLAVGALASQLMPVRSRASGLAAGVFGVFYVLRLAADTTSAHWLLNVTPLGWIEKLQPLYATDAIWLLPIGAFICIISGLAIYAAGKRDLGSATFADKDSAKAHTFLLKTPFRAAVRLNRSTTLIWLAGIALMGLVYGSLTKAAVQAFQQSASLGRALGRLAHSTQNIFAAEFMGVVFFMIMLVTMFYVANAIGRMREDEAQGYVDNFLVRPVSRMRWLSGRVLLITLVVIVAGLLSSVTTWSGETSEHLSGLSYHVLLLAGMNAVAAPLLVIGVGIFAMGCLPRLTSAFTYGVIAWSFLIVMLSSGLNLNHWFLDTSILHQVTFAPAVSADWHTDSILIGIGAVLALIGALRFNKRDLATE